MNILYIFFFSFVQQKERDRQKSVAKKIASGKQENTAGGKEQSNRREFDDLISALRTGDVFGDDVKKYGGRRKVKPGEKSSAKPPVQERERNVPTKLQNYCFLRKKQLCLFLEMANIVLNSQKPMDVCCF